MWRSSGQRPRCGLIWCVISRSWVGLHHPLSGCYRVLRDIASFGGTLDQGRVGAVPSHAWGGFDQTLDGFDLHRARFGQIRPGAPGSAVGPWPADRHGGRAMSQAELQRAICAIMRSVSARSASGREAIFGASRHRWSHTGARHGLHFFAVVFVCSLLVCSVVRCLFCRFSRGRAGGACPRLA